MKKLVLSLMFGVGVMALSGCGGAASSDSSDGMFGNIPQTVEKYNEEKKSLEAGLTESNYEKNLAKIEEMKTETLAKLEKEGEGLNGKELNVSVDENDLKIETPLTLVYKNVFSNVQGVEFGLDGKIVAAKDLKLEIQPSELKGRELLGGQTTVVKAKLPVNIEFSDGEGNVIDSRTIGYLEADNNGEEAVVKSGTAVDFSICSLPVNDKLINVASAKVVVDLTKGFTSESMPE